MSTISQRLRQLREERKLKQDELADLLQCSRFSISNYENGRALTHDMILAYATTFGVSADWLLGLTTQRKPGGNRLSEQVDALALKVVSGGGEAITSDQLSNIIDKLLTYYEAGAPAGNTPSALLWVLLSAYGHLLDALRSGLTTDVITGVNQVATAGLSAQRVLTAYVERLEQGADAQPPADADEGAKRPRYQRYRTLPRQQKDIS